MKKLAIGCGIALLLTGMAAAGVAFYVYRQVSSTITQFAELGKVPEIERGVRNQERFEPPASEELTESQVAKLVQVQTAVRQRLGERMNMLEAKYKNLTEKKEATYTDAPALARAYADLAATWIEAKRTQVDALNASGLSLEEYRWIRDQAYRAAGMAFMDLDLGKLIEEARLGVSPDRPGRLRGSIGPSGPESNRARIAGVKQQLTDNIALASFGLL
jgi:hypothetical protein